MNIKNKKEEAVSGGLIPSDTVVRNVEIVEKFPQETTPCKQIEPEKRFLEFFREEPFPLTAAKLERLTKLYDINGAWILGAFYSERIHQECRLLIPGTIYSACGWEWNTVLATWFSNQDYFRCKAIGEILKIYENLYKVQVYAYQKSKEK